MRRNRVVLVGLAALALGVTPWATPVVAAAPAGDSITVTKVMVDGLGGVNVSGRVSCAGAYGSLISGALSYQDESGQWAPIPWQEGDLALLSANSDNYTVTQPSGRKTSVQVTHGSSRMNPCYHDPELLTARDGFVLSTFCSADGTSCSWETDHYGYDRQANGPLFDYPSSGRFRTGLLSVQGQSVGLLVQIRRAGEWTDYFTPEGSYAFVSATIKAVKYQSPSP